MPERRLLVNSLMKPTTASTHFPKRVHRKPSILESAPPLLSLRGSIAPRLGPTPVHSISDGGARPMSAAGDLRRPSAWSRLYLLVELVLSGLQVWKSLIYPFRCETMFLPPKMFRKCAAVWVCEHCLIQRLVFFVIFPLQPPRLHFSLWNVPLRFRKHFVQLIRIKERHKMV